MSKSIWYKKGLNKYLSENGFTHFAINEPIHSDFEIGRAYMIDLEGKRFGLMDMIASNGIEEASSLAHEFSATGKLGIVELLP